MAEATAQTVLDKISRDHLECPICCSRFKDPKMLDCLHSFCLNCLKSYLSWVRETEKITCPLCRREMQVPGGELENLPSSFFLRALVDDVGQQEKVLEEASKPTATCDCGEGKEATWRCLDCSSQEYWKPHERFKHTKNHQIISLGDWQHLRIRPADCIMHSYCLKCLAETRSKQKSATEKIPCPDGRGEMKVKDEGEEQQEAVLLGEASIPTATCDCGEGKEVIWRCLDCSDNLCQECWKAHRWFKSTKNHQIISLRDWQESKIPQAEHSEPITQMCIKHTDHPLCFYCDTCDILICSKCAAFDHRSAEHNFLPIDDAVRSFRSEVDDILQKFEKWKQRLKSTETSIEHARNRLQKKLAQARSDITTKAKAEIAKIRNKVKLLTKKVNKIGQERDSEYEKALIHNCDQMISADIDETIRAVNDLMSQADDFALLDLKPKVMHNLEFNKEVTFKLANHGPSFIGVRCQDVVSEADLGEVCVSEKWQLKEEFGKEGTGDGEFEFARDVACFRNGDIVVTDSMLSRLSLFSSTGQFKVSVAQGADCHELEAPWGVAVTQDDLLFVTDQKKVKVFDTELQFVREFTPSVDDAEGLLESDLTAVAVDEQRVAVADRGRKVISVYNLDGSLSSSFANSMVGYYSAISNCDSLVFANNEGPRLLCFDVRGQEIFSVKTFMNGKVATPTGVLCDDDGGIYVAVHCRGVFEVQRYDSNCEFEATVAQGLYNPLGMAFTPSGDVVVADLHSVKIFERM